MHVAHDRYLSVLVSGLAAPALAAASALAGEDGTGDDDSSAQVRLSATLSLSAGAGGATRSSALVTIVGGRRLDATGRRGEP